MNRKVTYNTPILVRFMDGKEIVIKIYSDKSNIGGKGLSISRNTPLARAIINQIEGKLVNFDINGTIVSAEIVKIFCESSL